MIRTARATLRASCTPTATTTAFGSVRPRPTATRTAIRSTKRTARRVSRSSIRKTIVRPACLRRDRVDTFARTKFRAHEIPRASSNIETAMTTNARASRADRSRRRAASPRFRSRISARSSCWSSRGGRATRARLRCGRPREHAPPSPDRRQPKPHRRHPHGFRPRARSRSARTSAGDFDIVSRHFA